MPKFVIERELPGAGKLSAQELRAISEKSVGILNTLGPKIQWVHSYVADDKIYCVYNAPSPELIQEHARVAEMLAVCLERAHEAPATELAPIPDELKLPVRTP